MQHKIKLGTENIQFPPRQRIRSEFNINPDLSNNIRKNQYLQNNRHLLLNQARIYHNKTIADSKFKDVWLDHKIKYNGK